MDLAIERAVPSMNASINKSLLKAQMALQNVSCKDLAQADGWSLTTVYRKVNGQTAWTVPEVQICVELLFLDSAVAGKIFFVAELS